MKFPRTCIMATFIVAMILCPAPSFAHWQLNNQLSQLNFMTTKAGDIGEVHRFKSLSGSISDTGVVVIEIDPASVDTLIPIRDERLQKILFQTAAFPTVTYTTQIDITALNALAVGASDVLNLTGELTMRDKQTAVSSQLLATKVNARTVLVTTLAPMLISAASFDLQSAVNELREIAGLSSISLSVPVTFTVTFQG